MVFLWRPCVSVAHKTPDSVFIGPVTDWFACETLTIVGFFCINTLRNVETFRDIRATLPVSLVSMVKKDRLYFKILNILYFLHV